MTDAELVRDALDEFMPCYGSEESAKRKREVLDAFGGIVARVAELEEILRDALGSFKCTQTPAHYPRLHWSRRACSLLGEPVISPSHISFTNP